jgi:hypothetical protein
MNSPRTAIASPAPRIWYRYPLTIFCAAFLLFQMQLILGKYILPWFGGAPSVWTTCLLFFQLLLLGGYLYSHLISTRLSARGQMLVHAAMLVLSLAGVGLGAWLWKTPLLPGAWWKPDSPDQPAWNILKLLGAAAGLPYLVLSTTSPLLQRWQSSTRPLESTYRLYALSNLGSLLGLITYPLLLEPLFGLHLQAWLWFLVYLIFAGSSFACIWKMRGETVFTLPEEQPAAHSETPPLVHQLLWFLLPAAASLMLMAVTNLLCQEIAVVPFLWVLPLSLYLISFIICFDRPNWYRRGIFHTLLAVALPAAIIVLATAARAPAIRLIWMMSLVLFACCMACHGELARLKPRAACLTRFYLCVSAGGAAGGVFVAVLAPGIFNRYWEFHFGLAACVLLLMAVIVRDPKSWWYGPRPALLGACIFLGLVAVPYLLTRPSIVQVSNPSDALQENDHRYYAAIGIMTLLAAIVALRSRKQSPRYSRINFSQFAACMVLVAFGIALWRLAAPEPSVIRTDRNFYGVLMIEDQSSGDQHHARVLTHGKTIHGSQLRESPRQPTTYYVADSGIGLFLLGQGPCPEPCSRRYGMIGMGTGTLATYGLRGETIRFYEINPQVIAYSQADAPFFTYIRDSAARIEIVPGDARITLEREFRETGSQKFDLLVVDAFSSDSIPVHLLTREAFRLYRQHLRGPDSVLAFHISNRNLDLRPVLAAHAIASHLYLLRTFGGTDTKSDWVFLSASQQPLLLSSLRAQAASMPAAGEALLWTDDDSSLLQVLRWRHW